MEKVFFVFMALSLLAMFVGYFLFFSGIWFGFLLFFYGGSSSLIFLAGYMLIREIE